jgi:hypothetical protein
MLMDVEQNRNGHQTKPQRMLDGTATNVRQNRNGRQREQNGTK